MWEVNVYTTDSFAWFAIFFFITLGKQFVLPFYTQVKCSCRLLYIIRVSNIHSQKKNGSFSLVATWTFHFSYSTPLQKLVVAGLIYFIVWYPEIKQWITPFWLIRANAFFPDSIFCKTIQFAQHAAASDLIISHFSLFSSLSQDLEKTVFHCFLWAVAAIMHYPFSRSRRPSLFPCYELHVIYMQHLQANILNNILPYWTCLLLNPVTIQPPQLIPATFSHDPDCFPSNTNSAWLTSF